MKEIAAGKWRVTIPKDPLYLLDNGGEHHPPMLVLHPRIRVAEATNVHRDPRRYSLPRDVADGRTIWVTLPEAIDPAKLGTEIASAEAVFLLEAIRDSWLKARAAGTLTELDENGRTAQVMLYEQLNARTLLLDGGGAGRWDAAQWLAENTTVLCDDLGRQAEVEVEGASITAATDDETLGIICETILAGARRDNAVIDGLYAHLQAHRAACHPR